MDSDLSKPGRRLLASTIDYIAQNAPERSWVSVPRDDDNLSQGYVDITFRQFSSAVNRSAKWLDATLGQSRGDFEAFAYEGPKDVRLPVLAVAASKVGRKVSF